MAYRVSVAEIRGDPNAGRVEVAFDHHRRTTALSMPGAKVKPSGAIWDTCRLSVRIGTVDASATDVTLGRPAAVFHVRRTCPRVSS